MDDYQKRYIETLGDLLSAVAGDATQKRSYIGFEKHNPPIETREMRGALFDIENPVSFATISNAGEIIPEMLEREIGLVAKRDFLAHHGGQRGGNRWIELLSPEALEKLEKSVKVKQEDIVEYLEFHKLPPAEQSAYMLINDDRFNIEAYNVNIKPSFIGGLLGLITEKPDFLIRVKVGDFPSRADAEKFTENLAEKLRKADFIEGLVKCQRASRDIPKREGDVFDSAGENRCTILFSVREGKLKELLNEAVARLNLPERP